MKIPTYARYDYCAKRACEFLEEYSISSYPIDVEKIITDSHWGLTPYSLLMEQFNCDRETVIRCLRSKDGYTQLDKDNYSIAYNDDPALGDRKRFTLMHEIGHIYLNHLVDFDITLLYRGSLSQDENKVLENEANAFARNVLAPVSLVQQLTDKAPKNISAKFGITYHAASTRRDFFRRDYEIVDSNGLLQRMRNIFYKFYNKTTCNKCNASFSFRYRNFCPICGSKNTLKWGDGKMKYTTKILLDQNSKAVRCPVCDNEEISPNGNYCHICGTCLVNRCTNTDDAYEQPCGALAAANARYCIYCGAPTTFFQNNLLKAWTQENLTGFENIPDDVMDTPDDAGALFYEDDALPFN